MLNRLRSKLVPFTSKLGIKLGSLGLSPTVWSLIGFATSIASAASFGSAIISASLPMVAIGSMLLLLSGFFDIVDGSIARSTNRITKKGGFVDSILDKLGEIAVFIGIAGFIPLQFSLEVGVIVVSILSIFTFLQRFRYIVGKLSD